MKNPSLDAGFRPDIEGLRALAVLSVVIFHYSNGKTAGFVGVDVFFVISGFLITRLIVRDIEQESFSFLRFYARRARRILPALFCVVLATLTAGFILFSPAALMLLGQQATSALVGFSNVYFWATSGYFSPEAHSQPLLHTWSLGVEEQFYFIWPVALLLIFRICRFRTKASLLAVALIIIVSFCCMLLIEGDYTTFSFFMLPTRAWQLSLGGLLVLVPNIANQGLANSVRFLGLFLLLAAILLIDPNAPYPSISALLPTIGTFFLVWPTERQTFIASVFGLAPLRYFGRISYSLYLWHWPPMVMYLTWDLSSSLSLFEAGALFLFAWCAAHLSWQFVEEPLRRNRLSDGKFLSASIFIASLGAMISWTLVLKDGVPTRLDAAGQELSTKMHREIGERQAVYCNFKVLVETNKNCSPPPADEYHVLVMGDSHANHLLPAIQDAFPSIKISSITRSGCRPVLETDGRPKCVGMYNTFFQNILPDHHFDAIVLSARWRNGEHENVGETIDFLGEFSDRLIVLGQTVEYDFPLPELLMASHLPRRTSDIQSFKKTWSEVVTVDKQMRRQLSTRPVEYYSMVDTICPEGNCTVFTPSGTPLVWDYGHFNASGAQLIMDRLQRKHGFLLP